jgi:hypothetical protein
MNLGGKEGKEQGKRVAEQKSACWEHSLILRVEAGCSCVKSVQFYHITRRPPTWYHPSVTAVITSKVRTKLHVLSPCSVHSSIWWPLTRKHAPRTKQEKYRGGWNEQPMRRRKEVWSYVFTSELRNIKKGTIPQNIARWMMGVGV